MIRAFATLLFLCVLPKATAQQPSADFEQKLQLYFTTDLDPLKMGTASYPEIYHELSSMASKMQIREALKIILNNSAEKERWCSAERLYHDLEVNDPEYVDDGFLLNWARRVYREAHIIEEGQNQLSRTVSSLFYHRGTVEDAALMREVALALPPAFEEERKKRLKYAEEFPEHVKKRDADIAKAEAEGAENRKTNSVKPAIQPPKANHLESSKSTASVAEENSGIRFVFIGIGTAVVILIGLSYKWLRTTR